MATTPPREHHTQPPPRSFARFLNTIEWLGNLLRYPVTLFACFAVGIVLLSEVAVRFGLGAVDPRPGGIPDRSEDAIARAMSLVGVDGLQRIASNLVTKIIGFPPLGVVLVALLVFSIAAHSARDRNDDNSCSLEYSYICTLL